MDLTVTEVNPTKQKVMDSHREEGRRETQTPSKLARARLCQTRRVPKATGDKAGRIRPVPKEIRARAKPIRTKRVPRIFRDRASQTRPVRQAIRARAKPVRTKRVPRIFRDKAGQTRLVPTVIRVSLSWTPRVPFRA